jgi:pyruvate formate-lyase/glycerol dehydratase family glycyl radical enzyme
MLSEVAKLAEKIRETERRVDIQRALIATRVYRATEGEATMIRRAKVLAGVLSEMDIRIEDGELIIGNQACCPKAAPLFPEYAQDWILSQMDTFATRPGDKFQLHEKDKALLRKVLPYWERRSLRDAWRASLPEETLAAAEKGVIANENYSMSGPGHLVPDYPKLLRLGLKGIKAEIDHYEAQFGGNHPQEKLDFYQACRMVCDAAIAFARRYSRLAEELAKNTASASRQAQLRTLARICRQVPEGPAVHFWEALQSVWFIQLMIQIESNGLAIALGRFDQYMYPFYRQDMDSGRLTRDEALNLLGSFFCKLSEINKIYSNEGARLLAGPAHGQALTLGGILAAGEEGTNELTYLCLEADSAIRLVQPDLAFRINDSTPQDLLLKFGEITRSGLGKHKIFGDRLVIDSLIQCGVGPMEAREWGALGCSEPVICGMTNSWGNSGHLSLPKCLEMALNDGRCRLTGRQLGPGTGNPRQFASFTDLMNAFGKQLQYFSTQLVTYNNLLDRLHAHMLPLPFVSLFISDCLARGMEFNAGGAKYNFTSPLGVGLITTADSLAAMKKMVFEEKAISLSQLIEALDHNFEGQEYLRQMLINRAPKFGNDEDYVDLLANEVLHLWADSLKGHTNPRGGSWIPSLYTLTANIGFGERCGATPDGRKAREPFNDNISPVHGRERKGPTAVARSVGKLDLVRIAHGAILNMRFSPSMLYGDENLAKFADFIRGYVRLGGWHNQFNVVRTETLREAQKHPEKYRGLVIRVSGYSALFVELSPEVQEDIIARAEYS